MKYIKFLFMVLCFIFIFGGFIMSCGNSTFQSEQSNSLTTKSNSDNNNGDKNNGRVIFDDKTIIEKDVEVFQDLDDSRVYAILPVIEILKKLDCEILWTNSHQVRIKSNGKEYLFDLSEQILTKENGDYITVNALGGGKNYFRIKEGELCLNSYALVGLLREIEKPCYINIDYKTKTVIVTKRY